MPYITSSPTPVGMADLLLLPTPMPQSPRHPIRQSGFQTLHRRGEDSGDDSDGDNVPSSGPCVITSPLNDLVPPNCVRPSYSPPYLSTSVPTITTTRTTTQTMPPHKPSGGGGGTTTHRSGPTTASTTSPASSSSSPLIVPDHRGLSAGQLAGVIVGSVCGALLLFLLFLWRLRRGAFGSGTLFGFRYGDARKPGWGGAGNEMRRKSREGYVVGASEPSFTSGSTFSFLSQPGTKPPAYSRAAFDAPSSLHKPCPPSPPPLPPPPPHSPPPWSTSSSAFDNVYAVSSVSAHSRSHTAYSASASVSMSLSASDNSTLVSVSEPPYPHPHPHTNTNTHSYPYPRPPEHPPNAPLIAYPNAFRGGPILFPFPARRPPSTGETVSTSMVSFDGLERAHSVSDAGTREESEWEADTAESAQPLARREGESWRGSGRGTGG